jgi:small subunit ribosomal protein S7
MRRRRAEPREILPDLKYNSQLVAKLINYVMRRGKKSVAEKIVYSALDLVKEKMGEDPLTVLIQAVENAKPKVEVRSRRVGGATYQVPVEIRPARQTALALRWIVQMAKARPATPMKIALGLEIIDAYKNQGNVIKKRDDTHKMAQANKAFAHYAW